MLNSDDRNILLKYLTDSASDTVLVEAFENARRENEHSTLIVANYSLLLKRKDKPPFIIPVETVLTTTITPLIPDADLPSKMTVVAHELIAVLKRKNAPMNLAHIAKDANRSLNQAKPQLAVAVKRGLVKQLMNDLFEVKS